MKWERPSRMLGEPGEHLEDVYGRHSCRGWWITAQGALDDALAPWPAAPAECRADGSCRAANPQCLPRRSAAASAIIGRLMLILLAFSAPAGARRTAGWISRPLNVLHRCPLSSMTPWIRDVEPRGEARQSEPFQQEWMPRAHRDFLFASVH